VFVVFAPELVLARSMYILNKRLSIEATPDAEGLFPKMGQISREQFVNLERMYGMKWQWVAWWPHLVEVVLRVGITVDE
jgi:hypothetical protein